MAATQAAGSLLECRRIGRIWKFLPSLPWAFSITVHDIVVGAIAYALAAAASLPVALIRLWPADQTRTAALAVAALLVAALSLKGILRPERLAVERFIAFVTPKQSHRTGKTNGQDARDQEREEPVPTPRAHLLADFETSASSRCSTWIGRGPLTRVCDVTDDEKIKKWAAGCLMTPSRHERRHQTRVDIARFLDDDVIDRRERIRTVLEYLVEHVGWRTVNDHLRKLPDPE